MANTTVPYENATSGARAREEITALLRRMGCESVGFMDDFEAVFVPHMLTNDGRPVIERIMESNLLPAPAG